MVNQDMEDIIKVKCPFCGVIGNVPNKPGIEKKNLPCPKCKQVNSFTNYRNAFLKASIESSNKFQVSGNNLKSFIDNTGETTEYGQLNYTLGVLKLTGSGTSYQLKEGRNTVGRKSNTSKADFQIDTDNHRRMSREHLLIEVVKEKYKGFIHYISLCKENVNPTTVNGNTLYFGVDRMILNNGAIINLPDAELRFEIPDEDATEIL